MGEELLPESVGQHVVVVVGDVDINGVVAISTANAFHERQRHHFRMLAKPPDISLLSGKTCAMDAALLTGTDADGLSVLHIAHGVRLRVLQRNQANHQVAACIVGECLVLSGDVLEQGRVVEANLVASLLERDAEHLLALDGSRTVVGIDADDVVRSLALCTQNLECLGRVVGSDDAVAHLALDDEGRGLVAGVAQRDEVTIRRHAIGTAGTGIGTGHRRVVETRNVVDEVDVLQRVGEGQSYGSTCRRHVLERCCCRQTGGLSQFAHQLPGVQRVEEVDVAGAATQHFDG